ncbi:MAG: hypothetical protein WB611_31060 [Stellaceae bacterium]
MSSAGPTPECSRPFISALLLGYYDAGGRLVYAGRVGAGMRPTSSMSFSAGFSRASRLDAARCRYAAIDPVRLAAGSRKCIGSAELVVEVKYLILD